ncbi:hypothetical protein [Metapseudomonas otitidis]|uniref:hypothetical protein n=1 Tax=Metapseudomonas otitidis TaxID=319939 RepID=UPI00244B9521|nr:hypothetical protein [Pseudomonas otitidis]MDH0335168.1 hypothetical protein [Pseudomonas otitidis]
MISPREALMNKRRLMRAKSRASIAYDLRFFGSKRKPRITRYFPGAPTWIAAHWNRIRGLHQLSTLRSLRECPAFFRKCQRKAMLRMARGASR